MKILSKLLHAASWCLAIVAGLATVVWLLTVTELQGLPAIGFVAYIAPAFLGAALLLAIIPSRVLYSHGGERRDLLTFWISVVAALAVLAEAVVLLLMMGSGLRFHGPGG